MNEIEKGKISGEISIQLDLERGEYALYFKPDGTIEFILIAVYRSKDLKRVSVGALSDLQQFAKRCGVVLK